jgi:hypothetical protein
VLGIPSKVIRWDHRADNHAVSAATEESIRRYLDANDLDHVKVRINQYAPLDDWRRLRANKTVGWGYRYTLGALFVVGEAIATGDAIAYAGRQDDPDLQREAYRILYPAYGTYVGGAIGDLAAPVALPVYAGAVVAGHAVGRTQAALVPDVAVETAAGGTDVESTGERPAVHEKVVEPEQPPGDRWFRKLWPWP